MFLLSLVTQLESRVGCDSVPTDGKMSGLPSSEHCSYSTTTRWVWTIVLLLFPQCFHCPVLWRWFHTDHGNLQPYQSLISTQLSSVLFCFVGLSFWALPVSCLSCKQLWHSRLTMDLYEHTHKSCLQFVLNSPLNHLSCSVFTTKFKPKDWFMLDIKQHHLCLFSNHLIHISQIGSLFISCL